MKALTRNVLIQAAIFSALLLFAFWIKQGVVLLAFYGVMLVVILLGKTVGWLIKRAHLRRAYGPKPPPDPPPHPRWHKCFDDPV